MTTEKQSKILECIATGKYSINIYNGEILKYFSGKAIWKPMSFNNINGYKQYVLYLGRGKGKGILAYGHQIVWLYVNGKYDCDKVIDHVDNNRSNNKIKNLQLVTNSYNSKKSQPHKKRESTGIVKGEEILKLVDLYDEHKNYKEVERLTGINRVTIMYLVKRFKSDKHMKFLPHRMKCKYYEDKERGI